MGLSSKKPVLHAEHPVVVGLSEEPLILVKALFCRKQLMLTRTLQTCWVSPPSSLMIWHVSYISVTADFIHRLDPIKFPNLHNLDKDPFF
jgi:hypothetical protein